MKTAPHTPLPWRQVQVGKPHFIYADRDVLVAMVMRPFGRGVDKANAALIVRAVNAHPELVRLVREAAQLLAGWPAAAAREFCQRAEPVLTRLEPGLGLGAEAAHPQPKEEPCPTGVTTS